MALQKKILSDTYKTLFEETFQELTGKTYIINFISQDELEDNENNNEEETLKKEEKTELNSLNSNLKKEYTFDTFMIGDTNRFAYSSALTVAQNPGKIYNPLFIHGKSGLGKTHLMHAIGNYIVENLNLKVLYVTSDQFREDFVDINNRGSDNNFDYINFFKNKYRNVDVLVIDDIQFFSGAEKTRQEFFHTFEYLKNLDRQIIISSDRSPDDLKFLEDRLKTRFSWGLTIDIYPPDFTLKLKILKDKIKNLEIRDYISEEAIEYIAQNSDNDIRHLQGALNRLIAYSATMNERDINLEFAMESLQEHLKSNEYLSSSISKIQKAVADYYELTVEDLKSKKRTADINYPRQIAIYLSRIITDETTSKIGLEFGGKSHSTVIHACNRITEEIKKNPQIKKMIEEIKNKIN
jgi:chromosomal replication initiator protein